MRPLSYENLRFPYSIDSLFSVTLFITSFDMWIFNFWCLIRHRSTYLRLENIIEEFDIGFFPQLYCRTQDHKDKGTQLGTHHQPRTSQRIMAVTVNPISV